MQAFHGARLPVSSQPPTAARQPSRAAHSTGAFRTDDRAPREDPEVTAVDYLSELGSSVYAARTLPRFLTDDAPRVPSPREATCVWGAGEANRLVVVLRAMFA